MEKGKIKRVIGISGSPRRGGNTEMLLDRVLDAARNNGADIKKFILNELNFSPCQECENIRQDGACIVEDDWQKMFLEIENADAVVIASPIFFGSVSAQIKMFIDRFQCLWLAKNIFKAYKAKKKKLGVFICVEASDKQDFFDNAKAIIKNFFATIGAVYAEELFCPGIDKKGAINENQEYFKRASELGRKIISGS